MELDSDSELELDISYLLVFLLEWDGLSVSYLLPDTLLTARRGVNWSRAVTFQNGCRCFEKGFRFVGELIE